MEDLIDSDEIIRHLHEKKLTREDIYRLSDKEGFELREIQNRDCHKSLLQYAK